MSEHAPTSTLPLFAPQPESLDNPEVEAKEAALEEHERTAGDWLDALRVHLRRLYLSRTLTMGEAAYVCADDARRIMQEKHLPPPAGTSMNALGALFRAQGWEKIRGETHTSRTPGSHGNGPRRGRRRGPPTTEESVMNPLPLFAQPKRIDVTALCSTEERAVASLLNTREGADAAIQVKDAARAVGLPPRRVQAIVEHLVKDHRAPIGTSMRAPYGWYLVATPEEHEQVVSLHRSRAMSELQRMAAHDKRAALDLMREIQTDLLEGAA